MPQLALNSFTVPSAPTGTTTWLGTVWPADQLRLEELGRSLPDGHTVRCPPSFASVTVTFSTTALAPLCGTPPRPATCSVISLRAGTGVVPGRPTAARESSSRAGPATV